MFIFFTHFLKNIASFDALIKIKNGQTYLYESFKIRSSTLPQLPLPFGGIRQILPKLWTKTRCAKIRNARFGA